jgi:DNA polymerase III psi subunit
LALKVDPAERRDPVIDRMYVALTAAVAKAGLQPVRVGDVAADPSAAVMVFGTATVPPEVPAGRVLRADSLAALQADRERKRRLWERLLALGRGGGA